MSTRHFEYSEPEWTEILSSLTSLSPSPESLKGLRLHLAIAFNAEELGVNYVRQRGEAAATVSAIDVILALDGDLPELARAQRDLAEVRPIFLRQRKIAEKYEADDRAAARRRSNNLRPFPNKLMGRVAMVWENFGGRIDQGRPYRRFFEAAVKPVLTNKEIQRAHRCAWTDGMLKNHVEQWMKKRGTAGRRGRAGSSVLRTRSAIQN